MSTARATLANDLLAMAAQRSVKTPFGWSHPDCIALTEAARILILPELMAWIESPETTKNDDAGVLSAARINAHLIAAAPELYTALDELMIVANADFLAMESPHPMRAIIIEAARAALSKARGETP